LKFPGWSSTLGRGLLHPTRANCLASLTSGKPTDCLKKRKNYCGALRLNQTYEQLRSSSFSNRETSWGDGLALAVEVKRSPDISPTDLNLEDRLRIDSGSFF
jgi:hypothetical protein